MAVVADYDFGRYSRIIDVGGAMGSTLAAVLRQQPLASGVLFDLPQVRVAAAVLMQMTLCKASRYSVSTTQSVRWQLVETRHKPRCTPGGQSIQGYLDPLHHKHSSH